MPHLKIQSAEEQSTSTHSTSAFGTHPFGQSSALPQMAPPPLQLGGSKGGPPTAGGGAHQGQQQSYGYGQSQNLPVPNSYPLPMQTPIAQQNPSPQNWTANNSSMPSIRIGGPNGRFISGQQNSSFQQQALPLNPHASSMPTAPSQQQTTVFQPGYNAPNQVPGIQPPPPFLGRPLFYAQNNQGNGQPNTSTFGGQQAYGHHYQGHSGHIQSFNSTPQAPAPHPNLLLHQGSNSAPMVSLPASAQSYHHGNFPNQPLTNNGTSNLDRVRHITEEQVDHEATIKNLDAITYEWHRHVSREELNTIPNKRDPQNDHLKVMGPNGKECSFWGPDTKWELDRISLQAKASKLKLDSNLIDAFTSQIEQRRNHYWKTKPENIGIKMIPN